MGVKSPSDAVVRALGAGYVDFCDGLAAVSWFRFQRRPSDGGPYRQLRILAGDKRVEVSISPSGRSVRVFINGNEAT